MDDQRKVPLKLQDGKSYVDGRGQVVTVKLSKGPITGWEFMDMKEGVFFTEDGKCPCLAEDRSLLRPHYYAGGVYVTRDGNRVQLSDQSGRVFVFKGDNNRTYKDNGAEWSQGEHPADLMDYFPTMGVDVGILNAHIRGLQNLARLDPVDVIKAIFAEPLFDPAAPRMRFVAPGTDALRVAHANAQALHGKAVLAGMKVDPVIIDCPPMPTLAPVKADEFFVGQVVEVCLTTILDDKWVLGTVKGKSDAFRYDTWAVELHPPERGAHDCNGMTKAGQGWWAWADRIRACRPEKDVPMYHKQPVPEEPARLTEADKSMIWNAFESAMREASYEDWDDVMDTIMAQRRKLNAA